MKKIEIITRPTKLDEVKNVLTELGVQGLTVTEAKGFGKQRGIREVYRGKEMTANFLPMIKLEIVVTCDMVDPIVNAICEVAGTGSVGDGKIFIIPVENVIRIRTKEQGREAIL